MKSFLDLLRGNEQDWKDNADQTVPQGLYVLRVLSYKIQQEDEVVIVFVRAEKCLTGMTADFAPARYGAIPMRFSARNEWQFMAFARAVGLSLNNAYDNLATVQGRLFQAEVIHTTSRDPDRPFINIRKIAPYDPNAAPAITLETSVVEPDSEDEEGQFNG